MAQVELENLTKVYGSGARAVDSITLRVADRELLVLVGPSGSGKTTILRLIAGLEEPTEGVIRIGSQVVNDLAPKDRNVAMVFQDYALYPHMTVYRNMAFGLKLRRVPRIQIHRRVMEAAGILGLEHLLDRKPRDLSGGEKQRVAVGRALVRKPAVFLFDEPLSNLDAKLRMAMRAELKRMHQQFGTTTIYVTHDQEEAMTLGDRVVVLNQGRIQQADTPLATYERPANRFVAGFIGMPPMNFFDGVLSVDDGQLCFEEGSLTGIPGGQGDTDVSSITPGKLDEPKAGAGRLTLPGTGFRLLLPQRRKAALLPWAGRHVVLGIRPEHVHLSPVSEGAAGRLDVKLNVIEPLGSDMHLYMETLLHGRLIARVEAQAGLQVGMDLTVHVDLQKVHFFEPGANGMNLSLVNEPTHARV